MARADERRRGPARAWRRERGRWSSEGARRSERGDEPSGTGDDTTGYGNEWPEDYRGDFSGHVPQRYRDAYSERQSGPYRSRLSGRPVSEEQYRQEAHWHRSRPSTGFAGRAPEPGYEDPTWAAPQMGRTGGATERREDVENRIRVERPEDRGQGGGENTQRSDRKS